ncbi:Putative collagen-binding domain of a collagenase [Pricia antarctica]|uniref:Putative collagen-binding domain of a collagenase n=1 Tax=Pricia antarctica TaxID=641691 RepID=A0A1G7CSW0_9FLAO|nr:DUF5060 domain-containing protein [Pricia antarctica]SDE42442.1 Putative collagen-binding domain of a collagenase [Pricia antarctica]
MKKAKSLNIIIILFLFLLNVTVAQEIKGELKKWHKVTLEFEGPESSEQAEENPFLNYRLNVTFSHSGTDKKYVVPGYFAADGDAGNTSAEEGHSWKVHFTPPETGEWTYEVDFKKGKWASVRTSSKLKSGEYMDGASGKFIIAETDKTGRDFRGKGMLEYVGERYLKFQNGEYFLKCGADAPENFLAYDKFDGTFQNDGHKDDLVKTWEPHLQDWAAGDPSWKNGKGKEIVGAINYLASKEMNAFSFLTMNIAGDDQNVFPYVDYDTYDRFDTSKLDQWELLFEHADKLGMFMHFKTLEHENQGLLDNGGTGIYTKLYYRELIARFGHHLALNWNLAEETGDWTEKPPTFPIDVPERIRLAEYLSEIDPYNHHIVIHNGDWFDGLYGPNTKFTGASLQTNKEDFSRVHSQTLRILNDSKAAGKVWAVACDEPGDAQHALITDTENPTHDNARKNGLWGAMMAGAWGTEWYFGYKHPHSDLSCQDFRSRDLFWDQGKICLDFFNDNKIPVWEMESDDSLISSEGDYVLAKPGKSYVVFLKNGGESTLDLGDSNSEYEVSWYNPRKGGELQKGKIKTLSGSGKQSLGLPPVKKEKEMDWVIWVTKS